MKEYIVTNEDVEAINRLLDVGKDMAIISRDETELTPFECGILSENGYFPKVYGSGKTIAGAINEALGTLPNEVYSERRVPAVSQNAIERAVAWLSRKGVVSAIRR